MGSSNIEGVIFTGCNLSETNFRLARYSESTVWPDNYNETLNEALGPRAQLNSIVIPSGFDASGIDLSQADLSDAYLVNVDLSNANLQEANFYNATLNETNLSDADLRNAKTANLSGECPTQLPEGWSCLDSDESDDEYDLFLIGPSADFTDADLREVDLTGFDLSEITLESVIAYDLRGECPTLGQDWICTTYPATGGLILLGPNVSLSGADLTDLSFVGANLSDAKIKNLQSYSNLISHSLTGTCPDQMPSNWKCRESSTGLILLAPYTNLSGLDLEGVNFSQATLEGANLSDSILKDVDLTSTTLTGANLSGADFEGANLRGLLANGANLQGTVIEGSADTLLDMKGATFLNANLEGAILRYVDLENAYLYGVAADSIQIQNSDLSNTLIIDASMKLSVIEYSNLTNANFTGSTVKNSFFNTVNLQDVNFSGTNLKNVEFDSPENTDSIRFSALTTCPDGSSETLNPSCGF